MFSETSVAPVNVSLVKAWTGKRDEELFLPTMCTFGITLSTEFVYSKTTVAASAKFDKNKIWLNTRQMTFERNKRLMFCMNAIQKLAIKHGNLKFPITWNIIIVNKSTFPISARLNDNAARFASIVFALARLYGLPPWEEISNIARMGNGTSCRCMYGGFVHWYRGFRDDGLDSIGIPVVPAKHWPNMHVLILIVKGQLFNYACLNVEPDQKLLSNRTDVLVPERIKQITKAIKERNFKEFATITMNESKALHNNFKAKNQANNYMNDVSNTIVKFVEAYNKSVKATRVAYSFDLGANGFIYVLEEHVAHLVASLKLAFPYDENPHSSFIKGIPISEDLTTAPKLLIEKQPKNSIIFIIHTKIGEGPKSIVEQDESLIDSNGLPRF